MDADAAQRHALEQQGLRLHGDLAEPGAAPVADMARLADDDLAPVALEDRAHEVAQRQAAPVVLGKRRDLAVDERDAPLPLVRPIIVYADDIEVIARAAELGHEPAREHVPGLEDEPLVEVARLVGELRPALRAGDAAERVDVDDSGIRTDRADGVDAGDGGADERDLELPAALLAVRREQPLLSARIGHEGRLVHRCEIERAATFASDVAGDRGTIIREPLRKPVAPEVDVARIAVVEEIPDDLDPVPARRLDEGCKTGEIVAAAVVDERPAHGLAGGVDAERREVAIITLDRSVVPCRRHLIEPPTVAVIPRRALEA